VDPPELTIPPALARPEIPLAVAVAVAQAIRYGAQWRLEEPAPGTVIVEVRPERSQDIDALRLQRFTEIVDRPTWFEWWG
jgi:hypothetical protein